MPNKNEQQNGPSQDGLGWMRVSVQSPLGTVRLARRLPALPRRENQDNRASGEVSNWIIRRFELSNQQGTAARRLRLRRSP